MLKVRIQGKTILLLIITNVSDLEHTYLTLMDREMWPSYDHPWSPLAYRTRLETVFGIVRGCMDPTAINYKPSANTMSACLYDGVYHEGRVNV